MNEAVYWLLELAIQPGQFDNFRALMGEMVTSTRGTEPHALNYEWSISDDGRTCHIYERYRDSAAVMTHLAAFDAAYAGRFLAQAKPTRFVIYGAPDARVVAALAPYGPTYMTTFGGFSR